MTRYLRPSAELAPIALLPGDPARALALAQDLLERPLMANHARGLWGYTGATTEGTALTIQSTGIGGPSLAAVVAELAELGVGQAVRVGTCRALREGLQPGDPLVVDAALCADGASRALGGSERVEPDRRLTEALAAAGGWDPVAVASVDFDHDHEAERRGRALLAATAAAVDLATATLLALGPRVGMRVSCGLVVAEASGGRRAGDEEVQQASLLVGRAAADALTSSDPEAQPRPASGTSRRP